MIHTASLFHDDVIDKADTRRGAPSANGAFGNKLAILAGDFLLARASVGLARLRSLETVELLSTVIEHLVKGECKQRLLINGWITDAQRKPCNFAVSSILEQCQRAAACSSLLSSATPTLNSSATLLLLLSLSAAGVADAAACTRSWRPCFRVLRAENVLQDRQFDG
eukprot:7618-Heterococcus_DN1.PRE.1